MLPDIGIEFDFIFRLLRQTTASHSTYKTPKKKKEKTQSVAGV